jgi:mono/diheme cytochrome c family protein
VENRRIETYSVRVRFLALSALLLSAILTIAHAENPGERGKTDHAADPRFDYSELSKAPEKARARRNPFADDKDAVAAGGKVFEMRCAECHGENGKGSKKAPSLRVAEVQGATPGALFWLMTNGVVRRGMPVWSKLPETQRWQLVSYLQTLKVDAPAPAATTSQTK